jgi:hypothetical protein
VRCAVGVLLAAAQPSGFPVILAVKALEMLSDHKPKTRQNESGMEADPASIQKFKRYLGADQRMKGAQEAHGVAVSVCSDTTGSMLASNYHRSRHCFDQLSGT